MTVTTFLPATFDGIGCDKADGAGIWTRASGTATGSPLDSVGDNL